MNDGRKGGREGGREEGGWAQRAKRCTKDGMKQKSDINGARIGC